METKEKIEALLDQIMAAGIPEGHKQGKAPDLPELLNHLEGIPYAVVVDGETVTHRLVAIRGWRWGTSPRRGKLGIWPELDDELGRAESVDHLRASTRTGDIKLSDVNYIPAFPSAQLQQQEPVSELPDMVMSEEV